MSGWRSARLGDVCSFDKEQDIHGGLPYVGLENIEPGTGRFLGATNAVAVKSATFRFSPSHVLYGRLRPYLNKVLLPDFEGHCSTEIFPIRPGPSISREYLFHWLSMDATVRSIDATSTGARMPRANMNAVLDFELPVPPLPEQRRIVAILDEAFEGIATAKANAEKNLLNARELFTGRLEWVFSQGESCWRRVALESVGVTQTGSTPKSSEPENFGSYLPFVKPGDFNRDGSVTYDNEGLSEIGARKARRVRANSALMVCIGATIGKAGFSEREIATNQQVNSWTPTTDTLAKFIYYQMTSSGFQLRVRQSAGQATLPIINKSKWSALTVVIPPTLDDQLQIVADLDALLTESMNLEAVYQRKLAALDELKKSLLDQAFNGDLTARSTDKQLEAVA